MDVTFLPSTIALGGGAAATAIPATAVLTESHTCCWLLATIACCRTSGCTIKLFADDFAVTPNVAELSVHRPCSTQKTDRSTGSESDGTMRSLATMRSCLPPVTI